MFYFYDQRYLEIITATWHACYLWETIKDEFF
jgi:hypothetical protein